MLLGVGGTVRLGVRVHAYGRNVSLSLERVSIRFQSFISHVCKHLPTYPPTRVTQEFVQAATLLSWFDGHANFVLSGIAGLTSHSSATYFDCSFFTL